MTGQETPWGSIRYVADPNSPSGYRAITELSEGQQGLFDQNEALQGQIGGLRSGYMDKIGGLMGTDFDMNAGRAREITDMQRTFLDPQWQQQDTSLEANLLNRGIRPGSAQYENMRRQFGNQRDNAYNSMYLAGYDKANSAALQERMQPFQELAALGGATPTAAPTGVNPASAPTPGVAPTDLSGNVMNAYNQQMQQYNAQMGGMYGLGGAILGGWAGKGFPMPF